MSKSVWTAVFPKLFQCTESNLNTASHANDNDPRTLKDSQGSPEGWVEIQPKI